VLAEMAVTRDAVSGGRVVLGLGAGWYDAEYVAFDGRRLDRLAVDGEPSWITNVSSYGCRCSPALRPRARG
jgi:hypothetical protein